MTCSKGFIRPMRQGLDAHVVPLIFALTLIDTCDSIHLQIAGCGLLTNQVWRAWALTNRVRKPLPLLRLDSVQSRRDAASPQQAGVGGEVETWRCWDFTGVLEVD